MVILLYQIYMTPGLSLAPLHLCIYAFATPISLE